MAMTVTSYPTTKPNAVSPGFSVTITPDLSVAAYAAGDSVGLGGASLGITQPVKLKDVKINMSTALGVKPPVTLMFFNAAMVGSTLTDSATIAISAADLLKRVGAVQLAAGDYYLPYTGGPTILEANNVNQILRPAQSGGLYLVIVSDGAWTPVAVNDMQIILEFEPA